MLTCNRYVNLLVFHFLNQTWNSDTLDYILSKYELIFNIAPDKILINELSDDFKNVLNEYTYRWKINNLTEKEIKILYFCYFLCGYNTSIDNYYIHNIEFNYFIKLYNNFFWSYNNISNNNMTFLLHENLRREIISYLNIDYNNEQFKYIWLSEKLNKLKND